MTALTPSRPAAAARSALDRCEHERFDPAWVKAAWSAPDTQLLTVDASGRLGVTPDLALPLRHPAEEFDDQRHFLLGTAGQQAVFVEARPVAGPAAGLRELLPLLDDAERELAVAAVALANWHHGLPHCGSCGSKTLVSAGGLVRNCPTCGRERFPRTDPAVIVAVLDADDRLLLGHQAAWPKGRMSLLAGFVTVGESLEQAVDREVREETGLLLSALRYVASESWPFPRALMLGFVARATSTTIRVDQVEIEHARWFTRAELTAAVAAAEVTLPAGPSMSTSLISAWRTQTLPAPDAD